jgi:hypothetical protein
MTAPLRWKMAKSPREDLLVTFRDAGGAVIHEFVSAANSPDSVPTFTMGDIVEVDDGSAGTVTTVRGRVAIVKHFMTSGSNSYSYSLQIECEDSRII